MTFEEAAEKLKRERDGVCRGCMHPSMLGWCENHCKLPEAFDMAIEALKQPEIIRCGECKYREIRGVEGFCDHITGEEIMIRKTDYCKWAERRTDD